LAAQSYKEPAAKKKPLSLIILIGAILIGLLMIAAGGFIVLNTNLKSSNPSLK
jgi:flagellar basal body-associated protein FliL